MSRSPITQVLQRGSVTPEDDLLRLLWELPRFWRAAMDRRLRPLGLSEAKWRTVLLLSRRGTDITQVELAQLLGIEAPTVARLLDRLSADGWVERRAVAHDRRVNTIHLLPKASRITKKIDAVIVTMRKEALRDLSKTEILACTRTMQKVRNRVERDATPNTAAGKSPRRK